MACHTINNIADSYAHEHDAMEWKNKIKSVVEEYGNQPFYIFPLLCQKQKFMILNEPNEGKYTIEVPSRKEYHFKNIWKNVVF